MILELPRDEFFPKSVQAVTRDIAKNRVGISSLTKCLIELSHDALVVLP
jgi:hypothetical protein